ncbi:hypothetical protein OG232_02450 [Streptomyces sp. NBC_01411]|uniref:hypothetical protein n=1 Tax=Streptomyces sp. NBC_01411 TaxID=2903857 RepID=UPI0032485158
MVFSVMVLIGVAVSCGIGTWVTRDAPRAPGHTDLQAVCEQLKDACPDAARDTCRELVAHAREGSTGAGSGQG